VERQNLTMRMQMRRFTRLTNAFSKKLENLKAAVALDFDHYNFVRVHSSLRVTPGRGCHRSPVVNLIAYSRGKLGHYQIPLHFPQINLKY
jgi:hypothetical protein